MAAAVWPARVHIPEDSACQVNKLHMQHSGVVSGAASQEQQGQQYKILQCWQPD
jgi:hypothetical protein